MTNKSESKSEVRYLPVGNYSLQGSISQEFILLGYMNFPSDIRSAHHFAHVISKDAIGVESGDFTDHSAVARLIINSARNKQKQAELSGHIALAMTELFANQRRVSLTRAMHLIEKFAGDTDAEFKYGLPLSKRSVREAFKDFGNVSHFWAAMIAYPDLYLGMFESSERFNDFLAMSACIQGFLADHLDPQTSWNPWRVPPEFASPETMHIPSLLNAEYLDHADAYRKSGGA
ncbi:hypothetical protein [Sulfitobacter sp. 1A12056]|uniref:hypothetical protein n=1 Tax=Sulfitobacter sp. 1A12056 TaxID=3368592 RepID=UPI0037470A56